MLSAAQPQIDVPLDGCTEKKFKICW